MADGYRIRKIPVNVTDSGRCFNGLFRTRNLIEGLVLAAIPALLLGLFFHPETVTTKIQVMSVVCGLPLAGGILGVPPYSLVEFIKLFTSFRKGKHYAKYNPRLKWESKPEFLFHGMEEPFVKQLMNALDLLFNKTPDDDVIDRNITNPTHNEQFVEDKEFLIEHELVPDELKTPAQKRADEKARKRAKKEAERKARQEAKEAKRNGKTPKQRR